MAKKKSLTNLFDSSTSSSNSYFTPGTFTPGVFQGSSREFKEYDNTIEREGLERMRKERKEAAEAQLKQDEVFNKLSSDMYNDEETNQFLLNYKKELEAERKRYADVGDPAGAIKSAIGSVGKMLNDPKITGRIDYGIARKEFDKEIDTKQGDGKISAATAEYAKKQAVGYKDGPDGTKGASFKRPNIYDDPNYESFAVTAFKLINPDSKTWQSGSSTETGSTKSAGSMKKISSEEILANIKTLYDNNITIREQIFQDYNVSKYKLDKLEDEIATYTALVKQYPTNEEYKLKLANAEDRAAQERAAFSNATKGTNSYDYATFLTNKLLNTSYAKSLAYIDSSTINEVIKALKSTDGSGNGSGNDSGLYNYSGTEQGPTTVQYTDEDGSAYTVLLSDLPVAEDGSIQITPEALGLDAKNRRIYQQGVPNN